MIYTAIRAEEAIDQGDLIEECPSVIISTIAIGQSLEDVHFESGRVVVLTQTCDLANDKTAIAVVAEAQNAQRFVDDGIFKPADIKGPLRSGRIWGLYFLPADDGLGLPEMIVDFRRLHTVKIDLLRTLCRDGQRRGRIQPLYREHLAKHFADTYSRIGLPRPYETL